MRNVWRSSARLSSFISSGIFKHGKGRIIAIGGGLTMTAVGVSCMSSPVKENDKPNSINISEYPVYFKRMISSLGLRQIIAEEGTRIEKTHPSRVSPLMKTNSYIPPAQWDHNWDKRDPESLVKPLKSNASEEEVEAHQKKIEEATPTARRTYILVRHGQYEMKDTDEERVLTPLGREQANATGERLKTLWKHLQNKESTGNTKRELNIGSVLVLIREFNQESENLFP